MRWLAVPVYLLLGPVLMTNWCPDPKIRDPLILATIVPGCLLAVLHLRRNTVRGRVGVALGTLGGMMASVGMWAMGLLALAFASDSGQHAKLILNLILGWTFAMVLVPTPLAALFLGALMDRSKSET